MEVLLLSDRKCILLFQDLILRLNKKALHTTILIVNFLSVNRVIGPQLFLIWLKNGIKITTIELLLTAVLCVQAKTPP